MHQENRSMGDLCTRICCKGTLPLSCCQKAELSCLLPTRCLRAEACPDFSNPSNGCNFRQIRMCPSAGWESMCIIDKTAWKMMCEMGISCGIRGKTDFCRKRTGVCRG